MTGSDVLSVLVDALLGNPFAREQLADMLEDVGEATWSTRVRTGLLEVTPVYHQLPLRLSFSPQALRDHFEDARNLDSLSEEQLLEIGQIALDSSYFYEVFHEVLVDAWHGVTGSYPDDAPEEEEGDEDDGYPLL